MDHAGHALLSGRGVALAVAAAFLVRIAPILLADHLAGDIVVFRKVALRILDGSLNPYEFPDRFYPYPPVWVWVEAASEWLSRRVPGVGFAIWVKLPSLVADLFTVALLGRWGGHVRGRALAAWLFALHPVSVLITGFHGQFDSIPLFFSLLALRLHQAARLDASALALAAAISLKSFPVLLLPFLLPWRAGWRASLRFGLLATAPGACLLVPYAIDNLAALRRGLFGYSGIADFGWIGLARGLHWIRTGVLLRSEPQHWAASVGAAKVLFLSCYLALLTAVWRRWLRVSVVDASLSVFVAFLLFYGSVSAQYLTWVVPLACLRADRFLFLHAATSTLALVGFYSFLHPAVLYGPAPRATYDLHQAGMLWVVGGAAVTVSMAFWLVALVRRGLEARPGC